MFGILHLVGVQIQNAQPLKVKDLCVAHNGTIANVEELAGMVGGCSFTPQTMSDTLIAAQRLVILTEEDNDLSRALGILRQEMVGSFCFTFLSDDGSVHASSRRERLSSTSSRLPQGV